MRDKILLILLFSTFFANAQFDNFLIASQQQFANETDAPGTAVPIVQSADSTSVAYAVAQSATNITLTKPSGVVSDDLLVAFVAIDNVDNETAQFIGADMPSGWVIQGQSAFATAQDVRIGMFYKVATASEPANYAFAFSGDAPSTGNFGLVGVIVRVSGVDTGSPIDQSAFSEGRDNIVGVTTSEVNTLAFYAVAGDGANTHPFSTQTGWTELANINSESGVGIGNGTAMAVGYKDMATAGATGDLSRVTDENDGATGVQFNIKGN